MPKPQVIIFLDNGVLDQIHVNEEMDVCVVNVVDPSYAPLEDCVELEIDGQETTCLLYKEYPQIKPKLTDYIVSYAKEHDDEDEF